MKNMQIAGTGNSRFMKSAISETATWEEIRDMLRAGTFPFDLNGVNDAGITERGTPYDVNSVLKDETAKLLGGDASMVPDGAFAALFSKIISITPAGIGAARVIVGTFTGTVNLASSSTPKGSQTINLGVTPKAVLLMDTLDYPFVIASTTEAKSNSNSTGGKIVDGGFMLTAYTTQAQFCSIYDTTKYVAFV